MTRELDGTRTKVLAAMLVERRDAAQRAAVEARTLQRRQGWALYTIADSLEGSAAAYSVACSIVAGLVGEPDIETIAGSRRNWETLARLVRLGGENGMERDQIARIHDLSPVEVAAILDAPDGDHFAGRDPLPIDPPQHLPKAARRAWYGDRDAAQVYADAETLPATLGSPPARAAADPQSD